MTISYSPPEMVRTGINDVSNPAWLTLVDVFRSYKSYDASLRFFLQ
jgi:hypothetical protein